MEFEKIMNIHFSQNLICQLKEEAKKQGCLVSKIELMTEENPWTIVKYNIADVPLLRCREYNLYHTN